MNRPAAVTAARRPDDVRSLPDYGFALSRGVFIGRIRVTAPAYISRLQARFYCYSAPIKKQRLNKKSRQTKRRFAVQAGTVRSENRPHAMTINLMHGKAGT